MAKKSQKDNKKALKMCSGGRNNIADCSKCPYVEFVDEFDLGENEFTCTDHVMQDALEYMEVFEKLVLI